MIQLINLARFSSTIVQTLSLQLDMSNKTLLFQLYSFLVFTPKIIQTRMGITKCDRYVDYMPFQDDHDLILDVQ